MKICMITVMTPTAENIRGTSALPFHLLLERENGIDVTVYSFNNNQIDSEKRKEVEKRLCLSIEILSQPKWFRFLFKFKLLFIRLFLKYPLHYYLKLSNSIVERIKSQQPDVVWVYGAELSKVVRQFEGFQRIHTMPDSEALYYYRMLGERFVTKDKKTFWKQMLMYPKFLALEKNYSTDTSIHYHLVGDADACFLKKMNPGIQAHFIRHPHYDINEELEEMGEIGTSSDTPRTTERGGEVIDSTVNNSHFRNFHQPKIRVLIAGQYNYYMKQDADLLVKELIKSKLSLLREKYTWTFLGKGWGQHVDSLRKEGYDVAHITFAPDYIEEICKHDIQITPISIGTGTKGKVLDALANGLLVIGTPYAMENIAVEHDKSCIIYETPHEVINVLQDIPNHLEKFEEMAVKGRENILTHHGRKTVSDILFSLFDKKV